MLKKNIKISVVMAVYNGEKYLRSAIDSILSQTYIDFEFIIIDDCSTDNTANILESYTDSRIQIIRNEKNLRLPASLNKGLKIAKGKYIARMDADDIAMPDRFEKQVKYLEAHQEVAVIGGSFQVFNEFGKDIYDEYIVFLFFSQSHTNSLVITHFNCLLFKK